MKIKKILIILCVVFLIISAFLVYLNRVFLPVKVRALIIKGVEDVTGKKVSLGSLSANIFKGLVLRDFRIYDDSGPILTLKEASCGFFILPFKKQIIIPSVSLKSAQLLVRRNSDNTLNILEPFTNKTAPAVQPGKKDGFKIIVSKIVLSDAQVNFEDDTISPVFKKNLENIDMVVNLSLPAKVKYKIDLVIPSEVSTKIKSLGEYSLIDKQLSLNISALDFNPKDFDAYYPQARTFFKTGAVDLTVNLVLKDGVLSGKVDALAKNFNFFKEKILAKLNSRINAEFQYLLRENKFNYTGRMSVSDTQITGIAFVDKLENIKADVKFNKQGFSTQNLSGLLLGFPLEAKLSLADYSNPVLKTEVFSNIDFAKLGPVLKEKLGVKLAAQLQGQGNLMVAYILDFKDQKASEFNGQLGIKEGRINFDNSAWSFGNINGKVKFDLNKFNWEGLNFRVFDVGYISSGKLIDYKKPKVNLELNSDNLNLNSDLVINSKMINITRLKGKYFNSEINLSGYIDLAKPKDIFVDLSTDSNIDLKDLKSVIKKPNSFLDLLKAQGLVRVQANIEGNLADLKSCFLKSKLTSSFLSLYGLKTDSAVLEYNQENGIGDLVNIAINFYGGLLSGSGKINLNSGNTPYWFEVFLQGIKIEELKNDTGLKDKDISGMVQAQLKLNGFSNDISKLSGAGKIIIKDGKLWELNLFKGFGALVFTSDFTNVVFKEGYCGFTIQDKYISTDNLVLKSNLTNITGSVKIGFDTSVDATLDTEVSPDVPVSGTLKDVTTAILGQAGRFGVIRITGNFKEPKFKFKPAVMDIIKGFKDALFPKE